MVMLSGKWTLKAIVNDAGWRQRIVVGGSVASDGDYEMVVGTTVPQVEGQSISVVAQAFNTNTNLWMDSLIQETMGWDNATGLQVTIGADDNPPNGDLDFNDLVVLCTAEDAELLSPLAGPRVDLTIPEKYFKGGIGPGKRRDRDKISRTVRPRRPG